STIGTQPLPVTNAPLVLDGRDMFNFGKASFLGGDVAQLDKSAFFNMAHGVFTYATDSDFGPAFRNLGLFIKVAAATPSSSRAALVVYLSSFVNNGRVQFESGTLRVLAYAQGDASALLDGGVLGSGNPIQFSGGALRGTGAINADVN